MKHGVMILVSLAALAFVPAQAGQGSPQARAFTAANDKMMQDMEMKPTGDADRDFAGMMIPHHQGAVDMAKIELQYGKDANLRAMAQKIVDDQNAQIGQFESWLHDHPQK